MFRAAHAGIKQLGNARVVQPRQHRSLARKAGRQRGALHVATQQLDGGVRVVQAIDPARQPDLAHAAFADLAFELPGAHALAGQRRCLGRARRVQPQRLLQQRIKRGRPRAVAGAVLLAGLCVVLGGALGTALGTALATLLVTAGVRQQARHGGGKFGVTLLQPGQPQGALGQRQRQRIVKQRRGGLPLRAVHHRQAWAVMRRAVVNVIKVINRP